MIVSTFQSVQKAYVDLDCDESWDDIADLLLTHHDVNSKHDVGLYNMAEFKKVSDPTVEWGRKYHYVNGERQETYDEIPNTVRRCKNNVVSLTGIVLDVDEFQTIEETIDLLDGIEYVLYTTFRHTKEKHKFRVAIPFSRPLMAADISGRKDDIINTFPGVDNASFTVSQSFYFHSGKNDPISYRNKGIMIDPYQFEYKEPDVFVPNESTRTDFNDEEFGRYKQAVINSLNSCSGMHYAGTGDNNLGVLTLVSICKSIGLDYNEFENICMKIADPSSALKDKSARQGAWTGWQGDKIRKETREKFIANYGGKPVRIETPVTEYTDLMKKLKEKYGK